MMLTRDKMNNTPLPPSRGDKPQLPPLRAVRRQRLCRRHGDKGGCNSILNPLKKITPIALIVITLGCFLLPQATLGAFFTDPLKLGKEAKGAETTVSALAARVLTGVIALVGVLCFVIFVYAGILWMTARGNEQQVETAKNTMFYAALGLLVVFGSYVVLKTVFDAIVATFIPLPTSE